MPIVDRINTFRRRGECLFAVFLWIVLTLLAALSVTARENNRVKLLYFFSTSCDHCIEARPAVISLSKEFLIEGLYFNHGIPQSFPFPIKAGDKKAAKEAYGVKGVPTLVVLVDGAYRQKIEGPHDIQDAKTIIEALANGAITATEASKKMNEAEIAITGWIISKGKYFKDAQFFITDRTTELQIKQWLPLETAMSPFRKKRPRLMSDVINKPVLLRGKATKKDGVYTFIVKEEVSPQKK